MMNINAFRDTACITWLRDLTRTLKGHGMMRYLVNLRRDPETSRQVCQGCGVELLLVVSLVQVAIIVVKGQGLALLCAHHPLDADAVPEESIEAGRCAVQGCHPGGVELYAKQSV